jgi:hypothetical protein
LCTLGISDLIEVITHFTVLCIKVKDTEEGDDIGTVRVAVPLSSAARMDFWFAIGDHFTLCSTDIMCVDATSVENGVSKLPKVPSFEIEDDFRLYKFSNDTTSHQ